MLERVFGTRSKERSESVQDEPSSRRDSGAAMVEMAFILGLLLTVLVGTVTAAIAFSQQNSIENAAREGSRFGATLPGDPADPSWKEDVLDVTRAAGVGDLDTTVPGQFICVAYVADNGSKTRLIQSGGGAPTPSGDWCYDDGLPPGESRVQVVTGRDSKIQAVFFSADLDLRGQAAARWERG